MSKAATLSDRLNTPGRASNIEALPAALAAQNLRVDVVFSNASGHFAEAALSRQSAIKR